MRGRSRRRPKRSWSPLCKSQRRRRPRPRVGVHGQSKNAAMGRRALQLSVRLCRAGRFLVGVERPVADCCVAILDAGNEGAW